MRKLISIILYIGLLAIVGNFGENIVWDKAAWEKSEEYISRRAMASDKFWDSKINLRLHNRTIGKYFLRPLAILPNEIHVKVSVDEEEGLVTITYYLGDNSMGSFTVRFDEGYLSENKAKVEYIEEILFATTEYKKYTSKYEFLILLDDMDDESFSNQPYAGIINKCFVDLE